MSAGAEERRPQGWDAGQRRRLQESVRREEPLTCPACGGRITSSRVDPPGSVAYVRRRVLLVCAGCHRSAAVDLPPG